MKVKIQQGSQRYRPLVLLLLCVGLSATACLQYRFANTIHPPMGKTKIYVPVFVDETTEGTLGLDIANAVRNEVLRRQPRLLTAHLGEGTLVLDGTVVGMKDRPLYSGERGKLVAGTYRVTVQVKIRLRDHKGKSLKKLDIIKASEEYITEKAMERTEEGRRRALLRVAQTLADLIIQEIDNVHKGNS